MCGIVGVLSNKGVRMESAVLDAAVDSMERRGPDDRGIVNLYDTAAGVQGLLGHRRLSILDTSSAGHQPMSYCDGKLTIVYNGEIYNFSQIRQELMQYGYKFKSNCDTEVILAAYHKWGSEFIHRCNGIFAIAIWDSQNAKLVLYRDRIGIKPLYYGFQNDKFYFASVLSAIADVRGFQKEIDEDALLGYIWLGYVPGPFSMFKGIHKLPPGYVAQLDFRTWKLNTCPYWQLADKIPVEDHSDKTIEDTICELDSLLEDAVRIQMISDVPLGAFLSGGIDSSTVVALMKKINSGPVKTFTIGFDVERFNEAPMAKAIAEHLGTEHHEWILTANDVRDAMPQIPRLYDEPFADVSCLPTMLLSKLTRSHVTVALSGDGGDEVFFGNYHHYKLAGHWSLFGLFPASFRRLIGAGLSQCPSDYIKRVGIALQSRDFGYYHNFIRAVWLLGRYPGLMPRSPREIISSLDSLNAAKQIANCGRSYSIQAATLDFYSNLPDAFLVKVDRASMGAALEVRVPLLDHRVVELSRKIPSQYLFYNHQHKYLLRSVLQKYVPSSLWDRPKKGFAVPLAGWFRNEMKDYMCDILLEKESILPRYFDRNTIHQIINDHLNNRFDNHRMIWALLSFVLWHKNIQK